MAKDIVLGIRIKADGSAEVRRELNGISNELNKSEKSAGGANRQFAAMASMLKRLASAYISFDLAKNLVKTVEQVQNMEVLLKGLTNGAQDYADVENYLSKLSQRHHKDNLVLADSFSRLLAIEQAGLITRKQSQSLLEGMSNMQSKTGASSDQMKQSMFGLSQALSTGVVHMEELNQVTEPMPGLLVEIARAAGFTGESAVGDLRAMVEEGKITSDMFGSIMVDALSRYQGAAEASGDTLTAQYADIKNAWTSLAKELKEPINDVLTPILEFAKDQLDGIAQDIREIKALGNSFDAIKANGMRPPGYVKPDKVSASSSDGQAKSAANDSSFKRQIEESEDWYSEIVIDEERKRYQALADANKRFAALAKQQADDAKASTEKLAESGEHMIATLQREIALRGDNSAAAAMEYDVINGSLQDLSEKQKIKLLNLSAEKDAVEQNIKAYQEYDDIIAQGLDLARQQRVDAASLQERLNRKFHTPMLDLNAGIDDVAQARVLGIIDESQAKIEYDKLGKAYNDSFVEPAKAATDGLSAYAEQAARNMQDSFADFLFDPFRDGTEGMLTGFLDTIRRMAAEYASSQLFDLFRSKDQGGGGLGSAIGSGISSFIGGLFHDGGVVGDGGRLTAIPISAAALAPAYHTGGIAGLGPDEMFAKLRIGEEVLTRDDPRHRWNNPPQQTPDAQSGNVTVINHFTLNQPADRRTQDQIATLAGNSIKRAMQRNG
jgi:tape measure domain-containing protein